MGDCCNTKCLSYASAWFQLVFSIIGILLVIFVGMFVPPEQLEKEFGSVNAATFILILLGALLLINVGFSVTLIVGLNQDRITLVKIYLYPNIVCTILYVFVALANFILGFINQNPVGSVFCKFFADLLSLGLTVLLLLPIYLHFKNMKVPRRPAEQYGYLTTK